MDDTKELLFSEHNRDDTHMNSKRLGQHIQDLHKFKPSKIPAWRRESGTVTYGNRKAVFSNGLTLCI